MPNHIATFGGGSIKVKVMRPYGIWSLDPCNPLVKITVSQPFTFCCLAPGKEDRLMKLLAGEQARGRFQKCGE